MSKWVIKTPELENELYHHGIQGQKWGVKHGPPYPLDKETSHKVSSKDHNSGKKGSRPWETKKYKSERENWSDDRKEVDELLRKGIKNLSDDELRIIQNRLNLEDNVSRLEVNYNERNKSQTQKKVEEIEEVAKKVGILAAKYGVEIAMKVAEDAVENSDIESALKKEILSAAFKAAQEATKKSIKKEKKK